ncbi:MAG: radical SAM protein [Candidatus Buchananbacteria bacterium]
MLRIAWQGKHFGEEPPLVGNKSQGAGGIFFSGCNLYCVFCQNYQISQNNLGQNYSVEQTAQMMLALQKQGAVNINLVTPTIWQQPLREVIILAKKQGLVIPIVWNSNGYEEVAGIKSLAGLVDIYLPDFKYADDSLADKYSGVKNYAVKARLAIQEMISQVGELQVKDGLAKQGVIVRHLILPNNVKNSLAVLDLLAPLKEQIYFSLMSQYYPAYQAKNFSELTRTITQAEFDQVFAKMLAVGLDRGWTQKLSSAANLLPDFTLTQPFK